MPLMIPKVTVGWKSVASRNGIAHGERPVADLQGVAVAQPGDRKIFASEELDEGHVAGGVDADDHRVVEHAVRQAALHEIAGAAGHVKVGERVAVGRNEHARAAPLPARREDGDD